MSDSRLACTIVWLTVGDEGYGVGRAVLILAEALRRMGWRVKIVCLDQGALADECEKRGMDVERLRLGKPPVLAGGLLKKPKQLYDLRKYNSEALRTIVSVLQQNKADALHVLWPNLVTLAGQAARQAGVVCFWEMPNLIGDRYPFGLNRRLYQRTCHRYGINVLANSAYTAASFGDRPVKSKVFYLSADETIFNPDHVTPVDRASLGIAPSAIVLGISGRLTCEKGQDRVLQAMLNIDQSPAPLHLLVLGGPDQDPYADQLREIAKSRAAENRLHLIGAVYDPQRWYPVMDIIINNYLGAETFGLSIVEAMMMGRPALVHALGGPAETVIDGETGWHVHAPTVEAVQAGLQRALAEYSDWTDKGRAARRHALENFSSTEQARRYQQHVIQAMSQKSH